LNIINNDALTNIDGLAHLVSGGLTIDDNDALTNLTTRHDDKFFASIAGKKIFSPLIFNDNVGKLR